MATFAKGHSASTNRRSAARLLVRLEREGKPPEQHVHGRFEFPNPQDLRGLPAIGYGVRGSVSDGVPGHGLA